MAPRQFTEEERSKGGQNSHGGGRPPDYVRQLAAEHTEVAIQTLRAILRGKNPAVAKVKAAEALLNRAHGQPKQSMEISTPAENERVRALEAALAGEKGGKAPVEAVG